MTVNYATVWDMEPYFQLLPKNPVLYEFGVYTGTSIKASMDIMENLKNPFKFIFGFDSFEGLPKEDPNVYDNSVEWPVGAFNTQEHWKTNSIKESIEKLNEKWNYNPNISLIVGWYSDTLDWELAEQLKNVPAHYIHIDCDIYISTKQSLEWLFSNHLVQTGAIIRFDDWYSVPLFEGGESLAFKQVVTKYNLKYNQLAGNIFQYVGV